MYELAYCLSNARGWHEETKIAYEPATERENRREKYEITGIELIVAKLSSQFSKIKISLDYFFSTKYGTISFTLVHHPMLSSEYAFEYETSCSELWPAFGREAFLLISYLFP